jgi:hypothetical protein
MPPPNEQRPPKGAPSAGLDQSLELGNEDIRQVESLVEAWANRIRPHLAQAVEGIVAAGRELIDAKDALPHGSFGPLLDELGLSATMARRFMRVAAHPAIANQPRVVGLPAAIGTLDVLARLDEAELTEALEAGDVTPSTTRAEAMALVRGDRIDETYDDVRTLTLGATWAMLDDDQREAVLRQAVDQARDSGDPVALYRALDEMAAHWERRAAEAEEPRVVTVAELRAEFEYYQAEVVAVFRKYEGQTTAEGDTVTVETFAEHVDIPVETFRQWLEAVA